VSEFLFLSRAQVQSLLDVEELFETLSGALRQLSAGEVSVSPRVGAFTPAGLLGAMPGYLPDVGLMVKLVSVFPANRAHGLPSHQALIGVFDPEVGTPLAVTAPTSRRCAPRRRRRSQPVRWDDRMLAYWPRPSAEAGSYSGRVSGHSSRR